MIKYKNDKQKNFIKECIKRAGNNSFLHNILQLFIRK